MNINSSIQAFKHSSSRVVKRFLLLFLILTCNIQLAFSQQAIGYDKDDFPGWLFHRQGITLGDSLSPAYNLLILNSQSSEPEVFMQVANTTLTGISVSDGFLVGINGINAILNQQENADLIFKTNATNRAVIKNNGYVGIGIMNPAHILHVHGSGTTGGGTTGGGGLSTAALSRQGQGTESKLLPIGHITPIAYAAIQLTNNTTGTSATDGLLFEVKSKNATINLQEKGSITFRNANDVSMYISKEHNVGIGVTNPEGKLEIKGNVIIRNSLKSLQLFNGNSRFSFVVPHIYQAQTEGFQGLGIYDEVHQQYRITVTNEGKVGIGTTTPREKLTIKGKILSEENIVVLDANTSSYPDYVFEDNYSLMNLSELDKYIEKNNHLPEIPTADQVKKDGLKLAEMNIKLLKKIEELTLYTIKQQKEIDRQKEIIKSLEKRIEKLEKIN